MDQNERDVFEFISNYWSAELNNEVYLRGISKLERGSKEYFSHILESRKKYMYYFDKIAKFFDEGGSEGSEGKILEIGCGMGTDLIRFAMQGYVCFGIDLSDGHLKLAQSLFEMYGMNAVLSKDNAEQLSFENNSFDYVYSSGVIHHTPHPRKAIDEIYRVLRRGGRGYVMLYNRYSLNNLIHMLSRIPFENPNRSNKVAVDAPYVYRFSRREVKKMFESFNIIKIEKEYLLGAGYGKLYDLIPKNVYRVLSSLWGWHLTIYFQK